jgi:hypothetical protein
VKLVLANNRRGRSEISAADPIVFRNVLLFNFLRFNTGRSPHQPEAVANLFDECLGLLEGGEVAALG